MNTILLFLFVLSGGLGLLIGYFLRQRIARSRADSVEAKAEKLINDTKAKQQEMLLRAREKAMQIIDEAKKEEETRRQELRAIQQRLEKRESMFDQKLLELQDKQQKLQERVEKLNEIKAEVEKLRDEAILKLQAVAALTQEQAREELLKQV
ncbi:MAG: Rnase Y domain-containing protein, partial [Patescibacteria group bacterium]